MGAARSATIPDTRGRGRVLDVVGGNAVSRELEPDAVVPWARGHLHRAEDSGRRAGPGGSPLHRRRRAREGRVVRDGGAYRRSGVWDALTGLATPTRGDDERGEGDDDRDGAPWHRSCLYPAPRTAAGSHPERAQGYKDG